MNVQARINVSLQEALRETEERYVAANPKSRARQDEAAKSMPGGNTRSVLYYSPFPVAIARAQAQTLTDIDGHSYVDFLGEYTAGLYGHSHPVIMDAIARASQDGIVFGGPNREEAELARLMCARFPSLDLVRFTNSGTESNLMALVTARAHTGRSHVMVMEGGYHGGVLTFYYGPDFPINAPFPFIMAHINDVEGTRAIIRGNADKLAAILIEPMMGSGGGIPATMAYLQMLRDEATRHGIVLIFDEVMTSRMSSGGLQKKLGITPDLTTFGKYLGGGMTFGAFGGKHDLMRRYDPAQPDAWPHAGTFNNNVLTMAAGVAGLTKVFTPEAADKLYDDGERLRGRLNEIGRKHGVPLQATGVGSIVVVHWQSTPVKQPHDTQKTPIEARALFHLNMLQRGYYVARRGFMALSLVLTDANHDGFVAAVDDFCGAYRNVLKDL
ncbi:aspartate aminotransferase family protein [Reyranella sp. CPCC 100927]|uniref:aspartate aminotransferase family protein n=1 Tax=Reyranella sp. CPCC 100927 TaxID=2599616 RepID=UPI0011B4E7BA|nr:aminotransferase class III-fold pyridoxal phosphate-dependent enzyme [Reyranella sp. CPCC 100927]TWS98466.1 aminotransferase class III-fold pyridoxal phosphate-dependent enzyme [Reyranella sp. CPCC 100927]